MEINEAIFILEKKRAAEWAVIQAGININQTLRELKFRVRRLISNNTSECKRGISILKRILNMPEIDVTYTPEAETAKRIKFYGETLCIYENQLGRVE